MNPKNLASKLSVFLCALVFIACDSDKTSSTKATPDQSNGKSARSSAAESDRESNTAPENTDDQETEETSDEIIAELRAIESEDEEEVVVPILDRTVQYLEDLGITWETIEATAYGIFLEMGKDMDGEFEGIDPILPQDANPVVVMLVKDTIAREDAREEYDGNEENMPKTIELRGDIADAIFETLRIREDERRDQENERAAQEMADELYSNESDINLMEALEYLGEDASDTEVRALAIAISNRLKEQNVTRNDFSAIFNALIRRELYSGMDFIPVKDIAAANLEDANPLAMSLIQTKLEYKRFVWVLRIPDESMARKLRVQSNVVDMTYDLMFEAK